ncbi:MAG: VOC family protein [Acidimicrobiia bacterium]|nr:VOC family protein [Acidimicrobiia bacterium]
MTVVPTTTIADHFVVHGCPNWVDLQTPDVEKSKAFYSALLGWTFSSRYSLDPDVNGVDPDGEPWEGVRVTAMARCHDRHTAELVETEEPFADMTLSSRWYTNLCVIDILATLRRVEAAGGTVLRSPRARGSMATVATILDPSGALVCLWQPRDQAGNPFAGTSGSLAWIELETPDLDAAQSFYGKVFDWVPDSLDSFDGDESDEGGEAPEAARGVSAAESEYRVFTTSVGPVAGAIKPTVDEIPASWCPVFSVDDVVAATRSATDLGGVVMTDPYDVPIGRQSVIIDPEGAVFALVGPRAEPTHPHLQLDW